MNKDEVPVHTHCILHKGKHAGLKLKIWSTETVEYGYDVTFRWWRCTTVERSSDVAMVVRSVYNPILLGF